MEISTIPFGLLSGFMDSREIRITKVGEKGFCFRTAEECERPESFLLCFYDMKTVGYHKVEIHRFVMKKTEAPEQQERFFTEYSVKVQEPDYETEVRRLAGEYSRYIRLKLEEDDGELAKALTGYPAECDEEYWESLEEQESAEFKDTGSETTAHIQVDKEVWETKSVLMDCELAMELNRTFLYEEYLRQPLSEFLESYRKQNPFSQTKLFQMLSRKIPERFYIGNQFCCYQFPAEEQLFSIMDKMYSEGIAVTLAFSWIRDFMLPSVGKLLGKVDKWCRDHRVNVEILVNDWAMAEMLRGKTEHLKPSLGILLNKRKKDPRMKYKLGDTSLFAQNNLNAPFYREFLKQEFGICRYEWESCGYAQELPPGKNSLHLPFYQTNTSQYCPLYALCTTGERGKQRLPEPCPKFCEKYALLYPKHLHMAGRFNSLFGTDEEMIKYPETCNDAKGRRPDRLVINI